MIYYFCPDIITKSAGIRRLYRHVAALNRHGVPAVMLHEHIGFRVPDAPPVPVCSLRQFPAWSRSDVIVVPEAFPAALKFFKPHPPRLVMIALNWRYVFQQLDDGCDWRHFRVERVLVASAQIGALVSWSMRLPVHLVATGIDPQLFYPEPQAKVPQVSYIKRKAPEIAEFKRLLYARNPALIDRIAWKGHELLAEVDYAREIRRSMLFLNLSHAEGFPRAMLEAMRCGTLVAGYHSIGGADELVGSGERQNCLLAQTLDYVDLAYQLEPVLLGMLAGNLQRWQPVIQNGLALSQRYTPEEEERSVVATWREILDNSTGR